MLTIIIIIFDTEFSLIAGCKWVRNEHLADSEVIATNS